MVNNRIAVTALRRIKAGVQRIRHHHRPPHRQRPRPHQGIKALTQPVRGIVFEQIRMNALAAGVHPGIRAPRRMNSHRIGIENS